MTVKELRQILNKLPSKTEVVTLTGTFNELFGIQVEQTTAYQTDKDVIVLTRTSKEDEPIRVLIIS